jgi:hypothetical protein
VAAYAKARRIRWCRGRSRGRTRNGGRRRAARRGVARAARPGDDDCKETCRSGDQPHGASDVPHRGTVPESCPRRTRSATIASSQAVGSLRWRQR